MREDTKEVQFRKGDCQDGNQGYKRTLQQNSIQRQDQVKQQIVLCIITLSLRSPRCFLTFRGSKSHQKNKKNLGHFEQPKSLRANIRAVNKRGQQKVALSTGFIYQKGNSNFSAYYIYQMFRNQANSFEQELNRTPSFNWLTIQPFQQANCFAQPYFVPLPQITEPDFNTTMCYVWIFPCAAYGNQRQNLEDLPGIRHDDDQHSKEVKNANQNLKSQARQTKNTEKKRRKIIELQNIKENERNRNILSNCLKLAIKSIRNTLQQQHSYFDRIVNSLKLNYSIAEFEQKLNQLLPFDINYIRPAMLKQIFEVQQQSFTSVLKILIKKFFRQEIYTSTGKNTAMKKLIKAQHIKAGRKLLDYLFSPKNPSQDPERI